MRFRLVVINVLIARRSNVYLMRKTEYDEITIHNFAIHLVYYWTLLVKYTGFKTVYSIDEKWRVFPHGGNSEDVRGEILWRRLNYANRPIFVVLHRFAVLRVIDTKQWNSAAGAAFFANIYSASLTYRHYLVEFISTEKILNDNVIGRTTSAEFKFAILADIDHQTCTLEIFEILISSRGHDNQIIPIFVLNIFSCAVFCSIESKIEY